MRFALLPVRPASVR